ncbi:ABC transporter permease [Aquihabitans sp. G128]|uniref:ABC transporter permease n=1 Tax=Aquihabitans sp. G128 TaxID=2849779 RepID=UPI001C21C299|nr:ABC transporter permease [Aquihabitans sp. G128]QXC61260.1 ABC transporter permease [Aquihabitans sp. G128]QXC61308.1 ABC transporter permease [Aquihabitans sp. G128]
MTFLGLIFHNVAARRLRAVLTGLAVAIGVMAVVALGTLTLSLKESATGILKVGNADFTVAQKHTDSLLNSLISTDDMAKVGKVEGVGRSIGALIELDTYDAGHPGVIQVGLDPDAQDPFGVVILQGRSYTAKSDDEVMLGYVLAQSIHKGVGDRLTIDGHTYRVTGTYRTNISFGNSTMMFPLPVLQGRYQAAGQVSLGFVKVAPGANKKAVAKAIDRAFPQLATVASESDYGRVDNTLVLISAANTGGGILAAVIAISGVLNTSLLSFFERVREFGVLRSIGWSRRRIIALVLGEAVVVSLAGAFVGLFLGWGAINLLQHQAQLRGVFHPVYDAGIFGRSLYFAFGVAFVGALYPAVRAAFLSPLEAMRRE